MVAYYMYMTQKSNKSNPTKKKTPSTRLANPYHDIALIWAAPLPTYKKNLHLGEKKIP